ncbi:MAG: agmatine deiminase family protein [Saprospiraceae bacterium]|nr:agmatine deiminase family protein [Saprospiraceae bacterium]
MSVDVSKTPREQGYFFPAEFAPQVAIWLSWPHKEESWPGKIASIYPPYCAFVKEITRGQYVNINVSGPEMELFARQLLEDAGVNMKAVRFYHHPTNDAWCRDHGPAFLINPEKQSKVIVDWDYNAWGGKYPPFDLDDVIPTLIGEKLGIPVFHPGIIMEGGSVEFNGKGSLMTSRSCLLNPNRNPHLSQDKIEQYLRDYYGVEQILWVSDGIVGDDTDGHIDDTVRFVNEDTVITVIEEDKSDDNYQLLHDNLQELKEMRLLNGKQLNIIELPMPAEIIYEDQRLPASYANFLITNLSVIVPTFRSDRDSKALDIIQQCFPDRKVVGIDSLDIIWGLGSFHCLSQQEPLV